MVAPDLPPRYAAEHRVGRGGGGEVWAVTDRITGARRALKILAADATGAELDALVREAVTLSGLEGLGVPRVLNFGRLAGDGRPYLVRELVEGDSLEALIEQRRDAPRCLAALAGAAEQVTVLHRAGLLHGDIKPANVIVEPGGRATLVDLGLAAPLSERGSAPPGLTPKYAAPELLEGGPITVRSEVYALGVALEDLLDAMDSALGDPLRAALGVVVERATRPLPGERYPSADEFASALRSAARLAGVSRPEPGPAELWPIVGTETTARRLLEQTLALPPGGALALRGQRGSGRSVLLRRLAWALGVEGRDHLFLDASAVDRPDAVEAELAAVAAGADVTLIVDDADRLAPGSLAALAARRAAGARVVLAGGGPLAEGARGFPVPPLPVPQSLELLRRSLPSLTERLARRVVEVCGGRPGELRAFVRKGGSLAIASEAEVEGLLDVLGAARPSLLPGDGLGRATSLLDRGRYNEAREALADAGGAGALPLAIAWARMHLGLGDAGAAAEALAAVAAEAAGLPAGDPLQRAWAVYSGRAHVGLGEYAAALERLGPSGDADDALGAEALAYRGLALAYVGDREGARRALEESTRRARAHQSRRVEALAEACLGSVLQRADEISAARAAYLRAIEAAEDAGDASTLATAQLNLAGVLKIEGDVGGAIEHLEAAVDMGRRSGRRATVRQALLNLANADIFLGREARARASIETLASQRDQLPPIARAQLLGLEAELHALGGAAAEVPARFFACADAYQGLGLGPAAAEARLEGILAASRSSSPEVGTLDAALARAVEELGESGAHRPLLGIVRAAVARAAGDEASARAELDQATQSARERAQRDWLWRALEARAELEESSGQTLLARRDREDALAVLEAIASRLPRDLREVFWNEPRRRRIRSQVTGQLAMATTEHLPSQFSSVSSPSGSLHSVTATPLERRLARILEINSEILGEMNLERLAARVTDHAVDLLSAERGFVLLRDPAGGLTVHTSRGRAGDTAHHEFSRSVAERVVKSGEAVVSVNARGDSRLQAFASVHQLALESVACVPIQSRAGEAIGALYLETRLRPGGSFERELPTLRAFADQVAIALETAALIRENAERAAELAEANGHLAKAREELERLLGDRTEALRRTRQKLRDVKGQLDGHFGYHGLVGTSSAMRRVYALVDRLRDTDVPVLITGESGTGKELAARAIHRVSSRSKAPFLGLNCGAVPEHLLESELFGHVRGAFTGADRERRGLVREAEGGTLLLDEIGEMPPRMQTTLLRVLQERRVRPVGGSEEQPIDVRFLFATHRDLAALVRAGKFREDLYYRIHVIELPLPALRERAEDVPLLVDHFLGLFAARYRRERRSLSREAQRLLVAQPWPGNVRQLEHVLLNAWVLSDGEVLEPGDFDLPDAGETATRGAPASPAPGEAAPGGAGAPGPTPARAAVTNAAVPPEEGRDRPATARDSVTRSPAKGATSKGRPETLSRHRREEKERILKALRECAWNRLQAAKISGIPRRTFYRRLREYGIQ